MSSFVMRMIRLSCNCNMFVIEKYFMIQILKTFLQLDALQSLRNCKFVLQFVAFYQAAPPNLTKSVLVTEFLAGGDLIEKTSAKDYILTEQKCRNIVRQICQGVEFIHSQRYVHLDLKPSNIVFAKKRDDYDLRIIDYGLAMELGDHASIKLGKLCG